MTKKSWFSYFDFLNGRSNGSTDDSDVDALISEFSELNESDAVRIYRAWLDNLQPEIAPLRNVPID